MSRELLSDALNDLDENLIVETDRLRQRTKPGKKRLIRLGVAAACLCVVLFGAWTALRTDTSGNRVLIWNNDFEAEDYFRYSVDDSGRVSSGSDMNMSLLESPYAESRIFSDMREDLETGGIIPVVENHPWFECSAHYNEDGSLYSLELSWHLRGDDYSDLTIIAGYQEVPQITDCVIVEIDEKGNILEPSVTVTERDGIQIVAVGRPSQGKTLTFQNDTGWYQIKASWNDSYESMVMLLDWLWEHSIDFECFSMDAGDKYDTLYENESLTEISDYLYENGGLTEISEAFAAHIPDLASLGYETEAQWLTLKNGEPVYFEGSYYSTNVPSLSWIINAEPDYYDRERVVGDLGDLTYELVAEIRSREHYIYFTWDGYVIAVYISDVGTAEDLWQVIISSVSGI